MGALLVSDKTCKELGSDHSKPYYKERVSKLKINDFSWTHQRKEVPEKTSIQKSGETDKIKGIRVKVCLPGVRATGTIKS